MAEKVNIVESLDRISSLPDEILRHILSFLPTKIGFGTYILSTRWRYLFPFSNNLDFDESLVFNQERYDESPDSLTDPFLDFVDRCVMLMNDETNVDKFHFMCFHPVTTSRVNSWIRAAPLHNVRELDLRIWSSKFRMKRLCVFSCSTLVVLKLGAGFSLKVPSVDLPCLKILHLYSIKFLDDISTQRLFSGCPGLEDLVIAGCSMDGLRLLNFSSPSLKRLTIDNYDTPTYSYKLVLDAPSLVYLKCYIHVEEDYMLKNLHSLSEAHISIGEPYYLDRKVLPAVPEFLEGIGRVQSLSLSGDCVEYLETALDELPLLKNVTSLTFTAESNLKLSVVMKLLHCTPNLKEFIFYGHYYTGLYVDGCVDVPCCVSSLLRVIYNREFYHDDDGVTIQKDVEALAYFLKNAIALEKMWLYISPIQCEQKVFRRLRKMRGTIKKLGGPEKCEIEFPRVCKH